MSAERTDRDEKPEQPPPCNASCPHAMPTRCTEPTGHPGPHKDYGDRYPGKPTEKFRCTWKKEN